MSLIHQYGNEDNNKPEEGKVIINDGHEPKEAFDDNIGDDVDTAKPATVSIDAASDDASEGKHKKPDDHLDVRVSQEEESDSDDKVTPPGDHNKGADQGPVVSTKADGDEVGGDEETELESNDKVKADPKGEGEHLDKDAAGKNTTVSNEERIKDAYAAAQLFARIEVAVEGYLDISKRSLDNGGLSKDTAYAIQLGLESLNDDYRDSVVPALENFGETASRETTTMKMISRLETSLSEVKTARATANELIDKL